MINHPKAASLAAGAVAMVAATLGDAVTPVVHADWLVDLRTVGTVGALVISGTWWLAKKFQRIEDRLDRAENARSEMQAALSKLIEKNEL